MVSLLQPAFPSIVLVLTQTHRDQELRFTVHDSPDYYNLKVSVFNDDKKTELIGETWVDLKEVIVPGGGQSDIWHNLNCKGKYAGEARLELTYYDTRPKPEEPAAESLRSSSQPREESLSPSMNGPRHHTPVKRRPLPSNPSGNAASPAEQARPLPPAVGPRGYGTPPRQLSHPQTRSGGNTPSSGRRNVYNNNSQPQPLERRRPVLSEHPYPETPDDPFIQQPAPPDDHYQQYSNYEVSEPSRSDSSYSNHQAYVSDSFDGLPELPPMNSSRRPQSSRPSYGSSTTDHDSQYRSQYPPALPHSQSAPIVPAPHYYQDESLEHRQVLHHAQSDSYVHQPQPIRRGPPSPVYDVYSEPAQLEYHPQPVRPSEDYTPAHATPPYPISDEFLSRNDYGGPNQQWSQQPSMEDETEVPPPPPPIHRDSTPSSTQRQLQALPQDYQPDFAPAPLNVGAARESLSRTMTYPEPELDYQEYHQDDQYEPRQLDYGDRRYTEPVGGSPHQEQSVYRPRALSGDAMRRQSSQDESAASPVHGYSPAAAASPMSQRYHQEHRNSVSSYHNVHSPAAPSPLAQDSPLSVKSNGGGAHSQPHTPNIVVRYNQKQISPTKRSTPQRPFSMHHHSASEPYVTQASSYQTPPRPHPLAQEVPATAVPHEHYGTPQSAISQDQMSVMNSDPRQARQMDRSSATRRKSVSPQPPTSSEQRPSAVPFGPDSFDQFNPIGPIGARSTSSLLNHPGTPNIATSLDGSAPGSRRDSPYSSREDGKIIDFHGKEIDPSDRLPETSWAPEPEPKGRLKEKPARERERLTGARGPVEYGSNRASPGNRMSMLSGSASASPLTGGKSSTGPATPMDNSPTVSGPLVRNRLQKRPAASQRPQSMVMLPSSAHQQPFQNIPTPGPVSPGGFGAGGYGSGSPGAYGSGSPGGYGGARGSFDALAGPPPIPAKVPINDGFGNDDLRALSEEMQNIDIGAPSTRARVGKGRLLGFR
jgi:hypothetical protein